MSYFVIPDALCNKLLLHFLLQLLLLIINYLLLINFVLNVIMSKYYVNIINQIWRERWNRMQPLYDMAFDTVITWQITNIISQLLQRLQSSNLVGTDMRLSWYHGYMSRDLLLIICIFLYVIHICHIYHLITWFIKNFIAQLPRRL